MKGKSFGNARTHIARNWQNLALTVIAGGFSFQHIHDLALREGQSGLRAWGYPVLIDVVSVYCLQLIMSTGLRAAAYAMAWVGFVLFSVISLAANVLDALGRGWLAMAVSALPALSFLFVTVISHLSKHRPEPASRPQPDHAEVQQPVVQPAPTGSPKPRAKRKATSVRHAGTPTRSAIVRELAKTFSGTNEEFTALVLRELGRLGLEALDANRIRSLRSEARRSQVKAT